MAASGAARGKARRFPTAIRGNIEYQGDGAVGDGGLG